jgi:hypothetical protein
MPAIVRNLLHRPALQFGMERDTRGRFRDARFASFIAEANRKTLNTGLRDVLLRGRRYAVQALMAALVLGAVWFLIESAHALSMS